ncbi:MAG: valine--tRNA ligase [Pseudomonadales bacterium]|nr:valine--tRNA ligase [Pseudomonadales bacterium]
MTLDSSFDPHAIEQPQYQAWEDANHFAPSGNGEGYCILIPPPNVTGTLHMGHAFNQTLMDTLIRYQRMKGRKTLWQMGTDHAGIATQMLVERQLADENISRQEIGRDAFNDRVWQWKEQSGGTIAQQIRRMGSSLDWSRDRFTMDEGYASAVLTVFEQLYDQGLIYKGKRLVNWDPALGTAISDLEVENEEENGHMWHFRYPLNDGLTTKEGEAYLTVATTRPETMLGDTAVAVHPDDQRYAHLIGGSVELPLANRPIPIIADEYVEMEFGTGCVKITPGHDFNDHEVGKRHDLPLINIFNPDASISDDAPEPYRGLAREEARKTVIADLDAQGLLAETKDHKLMVPRGDRSGAIIEPLLTDQWFVKIEPLAQPAIAAVENGAIEFVPKQYENVYFSWMRDIQDWCISRQQWWGHQIPAFYDEVGNVYVAASEAAARKKYDLAPDVKLTQETDVLETWFSSALWPFATLGWPEETAELEEFLPSNTLITGHDIIFFWVARMIMMTLHFTGKIPFHKVYIHGLVKDADGQKMSKTKGNGLDPLDFIDGITLDDLVTKRTHNLTQPQLAPRIEKSTKKDFPDGIPSYGVDALRFTFCALATTGRDVRFDLNRIEGYRNFCNKIWNATRFVLANTEEFDASVTPVRSPIDRWITSKFSHLIEASELAIETYRFDMLASAIYEFAWHEYCDWYVELAKPRLWDESLSAAERAGTQRTLLEVLEGLLRLAHPVIPFITETIWQQVVPRLSGAHETIMTQSYPSSADFPRDEDAEKQVEWLKGIITGIRNIRGEANIKPSQEIGVLLQGGAAEDRTLASSNTAMLGRLANVNTIDWLAEGDEPPPNALSLVGDLRVMVPLAGLIDVNAEKARIEKDVEKAESELKRVAGKLANEKFTAKAPAEVVAKEREKEAALQNRIGALREQIEKLGELA